MGGLQKSFSKSPLAFHGSGWATCSFAAMLPDVCLAVMAATVLLCGLRCNQAQCHIRGVPLRCVVWRSLDAALCVRGCASCSPTVRGLTLLLARPPAEASRKTVMHAPVLYVACYDRPPMWKSGWQYCCFPSRAANEHAAQKSEPKELSLAAKKNLHFLTNWLECEPHMETFKMQEHPLLPLESIIMQTTRGQ